MAKKFHIKNYGCQMNVYDSDAMAALLTEKGWQPSEHAQKADLIILNTCHIRQKAADKIYSEIGRLRQMNLNKDDKADKALIAVAGCVAQAQGKEMMKRANAIDLIFGPQNFHRLPELISSAQKGEKPIALDFETEDKFFHLTKQTKPKQNISAFLTIQEGCDKFCSFCVVPYTRGQEVSRAPKDIIAEAEILLQKGAKELVLLGQNVNAYHFGAYRLSDLLADLAKIHQLKRLRYMTSHPVNMTRDLIQAHRVNPKLMPFLHLPIQSGSNAILKAMNRHHSREDYYRIIADLRQARPDMAFSSDFIVGYPGETEEDFRLTLSLVEDIGFAQAFSFKYSPRQGTRAALEKQIPESVKKERLERLNILLQHQQASFHQKSVGREMKILVEKPLYGKTDYGQKIYFNKEISVGTLVSAQIISAAPSHLLGDIIL